MMIERPHTSDYRNRKMRTNEAVISWDMDDEPWNRDRIEKELKSITRNWSVKNGFIKVYYRSEFSDSIDVLREHYRNVEPDTDRGMDGWIGIAYSNPMAGMNEAKIADRIKANQDVKGMTKRAIQELERRGGKYDDLADEYEKIYGEKVFKEDMGMTATEVVRWMYNEFPEWAFYNENELNDGRIMLYFEIGPKHQREDLEDALDEVGLKGVFRGRSLIIIAKEDDILEEDTIKTKSGKWTNKGDTGETHGEFRTKKEADAQRRAIFANWKK